MYTISSDYFLHVVILPLRKRLIRLDEEDNKLVLVDMVIRNFFPWKFMHVHLLEPQSWLSGYMLFLIKHTVPTTYFCKQSENTRSDLSCCHVKIMIQLLHVWEGSHVYTLYILHYSRTGYAWIFFYLHSWVRMNVVRRIFFMLLWWLWEDENPLTFK